MEIRVPQKVSFDNGGEFIRETRRDVARYLESRRTRLSGHLQLYAKTIVARERYTLKIAPGVDPAKVEIVQFPVNEAVEAIRNQRRNHRESAEPAKETQRRQVGKHRDHQAACEHDGGQD